MHYLKKYKNWNKSIRKWDEIQKKKRGEEKKRVNIEYRVREREEVRNVNEAKNKSKRGVWMYRTHSELLNYGEVKIEEGQTVK
jgi:hypothetical protein